MLVEKVYKRLLRESVGRKGLAILVKPRDPHGWRGVLYDPRALVELYASKGIHRNEGTLVRQVIKGVIVVQRPNDPCWGAWEVLNAAGPGYGTEVYGMGYALARGAPLISDRWDVKKKAVNGWKREADRGRPRRELDDVSLPVEKRKTPDFPGDDCEMYGEPELEHLNYAYEPEGWEDGWLAEGEELHRETAYDVEIEHGISKRALEATLENASRDFFEMHYGAG